MKSRLAKLIRCPRGNVLIAAAAVMPLVVGAGAVGVDVTQWALAKRRLQRLADSSAVAGGYALQWNSDATATERTAAAIAAANRSLQNDSQITFSSTPIVQNAPTVGAYAGDIRAVRVQLTSAPSLTFVSYFMSGTTEIPAEATAAVLPDPKYCMVALERGTTAGITFDGSTALGLDCGIGTNSQGSPAISAEGASSIRATRIAGVGSIPSVSNFSSGTELLSYQPPLLDPYAGLPPASNYATNCGPAVTFEGNGRRNVTQGCWAGMTIRANVNFAPGVYVINGGQLVIESSANITGENVTFILTGPSPSQIATMTIVGGATVQLSPPTGNHTFKGILVYQDRTALYGTNFISGGSNSKLAGSLYFPKQAVQFSGNSGLDTNCMRLVALRLRFTGNSAVGANCSVESGFGLYGTKVRLVG